MKCSLQEYPGFREAIEKNELVYLFGTGISSALTGQVYGWKKWIEDGIHWMKDRKRAKELEESIRVDSSTDHLIRVVGEVLVATKQDGVYGDWMQKAFEADYVSNEELAKTLRKMLIPQDVFTTTNYDGYLEEATGLSALSFEQTDAAFAMLESKISRSVLHIHGLYDSKRGIDTIVADEAQYAAVRGDQGAQFIQNLLGTRTLIFVGCGQTAEDGNISQFMRFARDHLRLDRHYYFLCKKGQSFDGLPSNVVLVPYGDAYEDLPAFLEEMAQARLCARMERMPLIGRSIYHKPVGAKNSLAKYHYAEESIPFCGREREREALLSYILSQSTPFSWWAITGQAGSGKSRLAMELLHHLPSSWFGFFLADTFTDGDLQSFDPFSHTLIVIDYVVGREALIAGAMRKLEERFRSSGYHLRLLLLERENRKEAGSWYAKLRKAFGHYDALSAGQYAEAFLCLDDLEIAAVEEFIGQICRQHHLPEDSARDRFLRESYGKKFELLRFRPLYVQLFVEAWIHHDCTLPRYDSYEDLLAEALEREQARWLELFHQDQRCCNAMIRLLVRAGISGALRTNEIPPYYQEDWECVRVFTEQNSFPGTQRQAELLSLLGAVCQDWSSKDAVIQPLFPDLLKEYMFFYYREEERLSDVVRELWEHAAHDYSVFLRRCMTDFPKNEFYFRALNTFTFSGDDLPFLTGRLDLLKKSIVDEREDPLVLLRILANEQVFWRSVRVPQVEDVNFEQLSSMKIIGLKMVADQFAAWSVYHLSPLLEAIEDMLAVPCGKAGDLLKKVFLENFIRELSMKDFPEEASLLMEKQEALLGDERDEFSQYLRLMNENSRMMHHLLDGNYAQGIAILEAMNQSCERRYPTCVSVLAHACQNMACYSCMSPSFEEKAVLRGVELISELQTLYPENALLAVRSIACSAARLQQRLLWQTDLSEEEFGKVLDFLEEELQQWPYGENASVASGDGEEGDSDAADYARAYETVWRMLRTLRLNQIDRDELALRRLLEECDIMLQCNPRGADFALTKVMVIRALHKNILQSRVSKKEIEDLFYYVELSPESETLREQFFALLEISEEAEHRARYLTSGLVQSAIQDARYNPTSDGGIPEVRDLVWGSFLAEEGPYRRTQPKPGLNDPCPCGSGKKYKKCCRGNGRFD